MANTYRGKPFAFNNETGFENEKATFQSILDESCALYGPELIWIDQTLNEIDDTFGEFLGKMLTKGISIRLLSEQIETDYYPEDGALFTKFGFEPNIGEATFYGSPQYFLEHGITPKQQDLIYYKKVKKMFEVTHIELLDNFKYRIDCVLYNYDHTKLDDTVEDEDILSLPDLDDKEKAAENDSIAAQESTENIINDNETDGIFD